MKTTASVVGGLWALSLGLPWSGALANAEATLDQAAASGSELGEIVVTAQKRSQKLSDVGITIVAATNDQLQSAGVTDVNELAKVASGFSVGSTSLGYQVFSLRGVNFNAAQVSAAPAVSAYVDEASLPYSAMTEFMLLDVERVEVLKGPQGTLFGQNATGGSINVIAAKPTDHFTAGVSTGVNNFGQTLLEGYVSGPLSDTLRARVAATTTQWGAWQEGYYLNHDKNGQQNKGAVRVLLDWTPLDRLKVAVNLNYGYDKGDIQQSQLNAVDTTFGPVGPVAGLVGYPIGNHNRDADIDPGLNTRADTEQYQAVLRADFEVNDNLTVTSISNYVNYKSHSLRNLDGTALDILNNGLVGDVETINQELRLSGNLVDSKLHYIAGANYEKDDMDDEVLGFLDHYSQFGPGSDYVGNYHPSNRAIAGFGNVDYEFIPQWTATVGARYTSTEQTLRGCLYGNAGFAGTLGFLAGLDGAVLQPGDYAPNTCVTINDNVPTKATANYRPIAADYSQTEDNVSWRAGLNFKPTPDTLIYGLVSRGFKSGVYPVQPNIVNSETTPVKQEELTSYEVGTKLAFFDRALRVDFSGFYYDYVDKQFYTFTLFPLIGASSILVNIPKSSVKGFDADVAFTPLPGLTLRGAVTYVDTKVDNYTSIDFKGNPLIASGKQFNFAPPWTATSDAEYRFPVAAQLDAYLGASGLYNGATYSSLGEPSEFRIPAYWTLDTRLGVASANGWRVGVFVRNLTDRNYYTTVVAAGDTDTRLAGMPRTYGVSAAYNFK